MIPSMISVFKNLNWCLAPIAQKLWFSCCATLASYLMTRVGLAPGNSLQRTDTQENVIVFTTQAWVSQILDLRFFVCFVWGFFCASVWTARQNATHLARPFEVFQLNKCSQLSIHGWEQWPSDGWALCLEGLFPRHFPTVWTHRPPKAITGMSRSLLAAGEDQSSWESVITAQGLAVFLPSVTAKGIFLQYTCNP